MWKVSIHDDPLQQQFLYKDSALRSTKIASASCDVSECFFGDDRTAARDAFSQQGGVARTALADWVARKLGERSRGKWALLSSTPSARRRSANAAQVPFILERTDIWCSEDYMNVSLRIFTYKNQDSIMDADNEDQTISDTCKHLSDTLCSADGVASFMNHVAICVLQEKLRMRLKEMKAVAFIANGAILPRKSGASHAPMASPPAVPFQAPPDSSMNQVLEISMGSLKSFLSKSPPTPAPVNGSSVPPDSVRLVGLVVSEGISLIVGGGYHGKSTLLRTIACGVYNKIPGDGREFSATATEAVNVRAEDGRYVNNCNISAFISNLPTAPGMSKTIDTSQFSTGEASGSTSQAANVVEAIEMGCSALLVDEDVSAANFMARDGRMRSLVMDESITPLLYRVNGLYKHHGISSIVVVGGVGDWLDVPDKVILMDKYACRDATEKARSVSRQFSHGHVQYGGRGVVHRLEWQKSGTPISRRPTDAFLKEVRTENTSISLVEGSHSLCLHPTEGSDVNGMQAIGDDVEDRLLDMSKCEQLMGKKAQLYGCGLCLMWLLEESRKNPRVGLKDLLDKMDESLDATSFVGLLESNADRKNALLASIGCAYRPRRFEVGQALTRLRGIQLELSPVEEDEEETARLAEEERKKQDLLDLWNARRKK